MPSHQVLRRPAAAVAAGRSVLVGDVLELLIEGSGVVAGNRALVMVHGVTEHGSKGQTAECTWGKWRDRSDGRMGERSVLPRRKRRPWPSAPVPERPLQLPRQRPGLALPSVALWYRAEKSTLSVPASVGQEPLQARGKKRQETDGKAR